MPTFSSLLGSDDQLRYWLKIADLGDDGTQRLMDELGMPPQVLPSSYTKRPIPKALRNLILERDEHTCQNCGSTAELQIDHILPERRGGLATKENLQTLCRNCNIRKGMS